MNNDLGNYRKSYDKGTLLETDVSENPLELFQKWFFEVDQHFPQDETSLYIDGLKPAHLSSPPAQTEK